MTMIVSISDPTRCVPIENLELDLDSTDDYEKFEQLFADFTMVCAHLYPGEKIEIECIHRTDEAMF